MRLRMGRSLQVYFSAICDLVDRCQRYPSRSCCNLLGIFGDPPTDRPTEATLCSAAAAAAAAAADVALLCFAVLCFGASKSERSQSSRDKSKSASKSWVSWARPAKRRGTPSPRPKRPSQELILVMASQKSYKLSEVAQHKVTKGADKSIWIVLHDKVYDVTKFLDEVSTPSSTLYTHT